MSWYFAKPGSALAMLSRFFSSIAVTEFSFSSVGASFFRCHGPVRRAAWPPRTCWPAAARSPAGASTSTPSRSLALRISVLTCWLRCDRILVTSPALLRSSPSVWLRLLRDCDSRVTPSKAGPSCGAIWSSVADRVSSDWLSVSVFVPAMSVVRSPRASVSEYGEDVRETGMTRHRMQPAAAR